MPAKILTIVYDNLVDYGDASSGFKLSLNVHHTRLTEGRFLSKHFSPAQVICEFEALGIVCLLLPSDHLLNNWVLLGSLVDLPQWMPGTS